MMVIPQSGQVGLAKGWPRMGPKDWARAHLCLCAPPFQGHEFVKGQGHTHGRVKCMVDVRDGISLLLCWALRDPAWCVLQAGGQRQCVAAPLGL